MSKIIYTSENYEVYLDSNEEFDVYKDVDRGWELLTFTKQDLLDMLQMLEGEENA